MQRTDWSAHGIELTHTISEPDPGSTHRASATDNVVRLHIGLRGDYRASYPQIGRSFDLVGGHHNVLYAPEFAFEFTAKTPVIETFGVRFPIERFIEYADGASPALSRFCERIARMEPSILFDEFGPMTPALEGTIREILASRYHGRLQELFVLSKAIELLTLAIDAADGARPGEHTRTAADRERIVAARDRLNERLTDPPTLSELARLVGLNEFKLKHGFKEVFGKTAFAYLTEQRLELARRYLHDTSRTAAEIATELGYATPQHFHTAFKNHFGVTPNSVRKTPQSAIEPTRDATYGGDMTDHTAKTQITIHAKPAAVWAALTTPKLIKQYMMGADVETDWKVGSPLVYTGEYEGKKFEEKGVIQRIEPEHVLAATHFSSTSGKPDVPENYALVTWELHPKDGATVVTVSQDGISSAKGVEQSKANWKSVLEGLKKVAER